MYSEDSFHTLSIYGRLAVLVLSMAMLAGLFAVSYILMKGRRGAARIVIAAALFWVFVWLSPQVYYTLYGFLFEGLPRQWVVGIPPTLDELLGLITFSGRQTLSAHGKGLLFWALVLLSLRLRFRATTEPDPDL
jgi:hypothetical protein